MLKVNILQVLFFCEHAILEIIIIIILELLFQGYHQFAQLRDPLISFVHESFVEQKLVFGQTCRFFVQPAVHMVRTNTILGLPSKI